MNIAIIGYGVVGGGVHALLQDGRLGIHVKRVLDIRPLPELGALLTDNIADILVNPEIDCVVETMGGMHPALSFATMALRSGKHLVTSNKELISNALMPLLEGAALHNAQLRFGASVGGGVPWLHNLMRQKRGDTLLSIEGVVNGTTNYILDAMTHGLTFEASLKEAQRLGYAEADASADLNGIDAQRKCAISAALAFDTIVEPSDVPTLGIAGVQQADMARFAAKGLTCKLMMYAARATDGIIAYVEPTLLRADALAAHTPTNHNCITLCAEQGGTLSFYGQGAGRYPTAEHVVQDLLDIQARVPMQQSFISQKAIVNGRERHAYYLRSERLDLVDAGLVDVEEGGAIWTVPLPVDEAHGLAGKLLAADAGAFVAGVPSRV